VVTKTVKDPKRLYHLLCWESGDCKDWSSPSGPTINTIWAKRVSTSESFPFYNKLVPTNGN